jgi:hypothetical protein
MIAHIRTTGAAHPMYDALADLEGITITPRNIITTPTREKLIPSRSTMVNFRHTLGGHWQS